MRMDIIDILYRMYIFSCMSHKLTTYLNVCTLGIVPRRYLFPDIVIPPSIIFFLYTYKDSHYGHQPVTAIG